jgi:hypothetical protein
MRRGIFRKASRTFFEKRTKNLSLLRQLIYAGSFLENWGLDLGSGGEVKVFCVFSSEKKAFRLVSPP